MFCYNCGGAVSTQDHSTAGRGVAEPIVARADVGSTSNGLSNEEHADAPKSRSDRSGRPKVKAARRQPAEIVWEPRQGTSWTFIVASLLFAVVALLIVLAAIYLR